MGADLAAVHNHRMRRALLRHMLPDSQRRTLAELTDDLDLSVGDTVSKRSAFWTMLTLSAIIASAGVLSNSTATVIGADDHCAVVNADHGYRAGRGQARGWGGRPRGMVR